MAAARGSIDAMSSQKTALLLLALILAACGENHAPPTAAELAHADPATKTQPTPLAQLPRSTDPRVMECALVLEAGELSKAQALLLAIGEEAGPESVCLRARLMNARGDGVGALRELELARKTWPNESSLFATAAEIHATGGRLESAEAEIRTGLALSGPTPDLARARGLWSLMQPGGAKAGLAHLLNATAQDPDLPFCRGPLAEAHRLLATQALAKEQPREALAHARAGLKFEPDHIDLRILEADSLIACRDFDAALPAYEQLLREGRQFGASLAMDYQRGATAALVEGQREIAVARYLRARKLGASTKDLGHGAQVLHEEAVQKMDRADAAFEAERWGDARIDLSAALELEPDNLAAKNQLGVACYMESDFAAAAQAWSAVLADAQARGLPLPDPVHLNLARALHAQGELAQVREVLDRYLSAHAEGEWVAQTREMLARLGDGK
jgi:tetratricopeptide (TPR) repeat protein